ncbi:MAG: hypothetical protein ACE5NW_12615 [Acidiferrobacterales bacterium]
MFGTHKPQFARRPVPMQPSLIIAICDDFIVKTLKVVVETGKPTLGGRFTLFLCKVMEPFTPKKALSENWP